MANRHRGEITALFEGKPYTLCLTLGALAELEDAFGADDLMDLTTRFEEGRFRARDLTRILGAGLRGGGHALQDEDVADLRADGGLKQMAGIVSELLTVTFGTHAPKAPREETGANETGQNIMPRNPS